MKNTIKQETESTEYPLIMKIVFGASLAILVMFIGFLFYLSIFQLRHQGLSPRGIEIDKFCKIQGYDKVKENNWDFFCEKDTYENNIRYLESVEVRWDNKGNYYLYGGIK